MVPFEVWKYLSVVPEPGYPQRLYHYFTATEIEEVSPTSADLTWRIRNEVFGTLLCGLLTLLLRYAPSIRNRAKKRWSDMVSMVHEWRNRPSLCRHCGSAPCQVKRRSSWKPPRCRKRDNANFAKRSNAMMLFNYGLELKLSEVLIKGLPQGGQDRGRKLCQYFEEEHMVLFPLCVQRHIKYWYPVPS